MPLVPAARGSALAPDAGAGASPATAPVVGQATPASDRPAGPRFGVWPHVGLGAGALALGGALGFEMARRTAESDAEADKTQVGFKDKLDTMHGRQTVARVLTGVGGALVVVGGTLLIIDLTSRPKQAQSTQAGLGCFDAGCGVQLGGRF